MILAVVLVKLAETVASDTVVDLLSDEAKSYCTESIPVSDSVQRVSGQFICLLVSAEFSVTFFVISEGECADYIQVIGTVAFGLASEE